jgi:thiamine-monophosphate kinase
VALSGAIGGFGAALAFFDARTRGAAPQLSAASVSGLRELLVLPEPAIELGPALAACGWCTACMDVTDGLGQSLAEIAEASGVGLDIDADAVPIHPLALEVCDAMGLDRFDVAFGIGLDLKLLVTIAAGEEDRATERGLIPFGRAREAPGLSFHRDGRSEVRLPGRGWQHFGGDARSHIAGRA